MPFDSEMCTWDLRDGRCVEVLKSANVHSSMTVSHTYYVGHCFT